MKLTEPQRRCLAVVAEEGAPSPREVARRLWPDSPAWNRRTRGRRTGTINGAVGGTMPMLAAKILWRLDEADLVFQTESGRWKLTERGRTFLGIRRSSSTGVDNRGLPE